MTALHEQQTAFAKRIRAKFSQDFMGGSQPVHQKPVLVGCLPSGDFTQPVISNKHAAGIDKLLTLEPTVTNVYLQGTIDSVATHAWADDTVSAMCWSVCVWTEEEGQCWKDEFIRKSERTDPSWF
tara:strand:+ start:215 stop:589 length:375 start_codon:yes stop_codon:yes gene_type:complete